MTAAMGRRPDALLLHTSDCHLGAGRGTSGPEEDAFVAMIDAAIVQRVDTVVIAGDMFDHGLVPEELFDWTAAQLDRLPCPVVILPGNHDHVGDNSVHPRFDVENRCRNAYLLGEPNGSTARPSGTPFAFWGRATREHDANSRPLIDVPPPPADAWGIVVAHGAALNSNEPTSSPGSPIYPRDLEAIRGWDYVALGHLEHFYAVRRRPVPAYYCGDTYRSRDDRPGVVLVRFTEGEAAHVDWVALEPIDPTGPADRAAVTR
ncbi:MAG: exonuclease SbcCD subunit D [Acidimicrobiia bacterium]